MPRQPHGQDQGLAVKHAGAKHQLGEPGKIKGMPGIAVSSLGPAPPQSLNLVAPVVGPIRVTPQRPVVRLGRQPKPGPDHIVGDGLDRTRGNAVVDGEIAVARPQHGQVVQQVSIRRAERWQP